MPETLAQSDLPPDVAAAIQNHAQTNGWTAPSDLPPAVAQAIQTHAQSNGWLSGDSSLPPDVASAIENHAQSNGWTGINQPSAFAPAVARWSPQAQATSAKYGVPAQLILSIIQHESGGDPESVNRSSGAYGLGNFLPSTSKSYPESLSKDPQDQVDAIGQYLSNMHKRTGDWRSAVRGYRGVDDEPYINGVMAQMGMPAPKPTIGPVIARDAQSAQAPSASDLSDQLGASHNRAANLQEQQYQYMAANGGRTNPKLAIQIQQENANTQSLMSAVTKANAQANMNAPVDPANLPAGMTAQQYHARIAKNRAAMQAGNAAPTISGKLTSDEVLDTIQNVPGFKQVGDFAAGVEDTAHTALSPTLMPAQKAIANIAESNWHAAQKAVAQAKNPTDRLAARQREEDAYVKLTQASAAQGDLEDRYGGATEAANSFALPGMMAGSGIEEQIEPLIKPGIERGMNVLRGALRPHPVPEPIPEPVPPANVPIGRVGAKAPYDPRTTTVTPKPMPASVGERSVDSAVSAMRNRPMPVSPPTVSPVHDFIRNHPQASLVDVAANFPNVDTANVRQAYIDVKSGIGNDAIANAVRSHSAAPAPEPVPPARFENLELGPRGANTVDDAVSAIRKPGSVGVGGSSGTSSYNVPRTYTGQSLSESPTFTGNTYAADLPSAGSWSRDMRRQAPPPLPVRPVSIDAVPAKPAQGGQLDFSSQADIRPTLPTDFTGQVHPTLQGAIPDNDLLAGMRQTPVNSRIVPTLLAGDPVGNEAPKQALRSASDVESLLKSPSAGNDGVAYTHSNTPVHFHWEVKSIDDVTPSHTDAFQENPAYDPNLQPRDRTRIASRDQVNNIAAKLNPARLADDPGTWSGAPIIGSDGQVESGNARTLAIRKAYANNSGQGQSYADFVHTHAAAYGIDPAHAASIDNPILVRVRDGQVPDRGAIADEMGKSPTAQMSEPEVASSDARMLRDSGLYNRVMPTTDGDFSSPGNRDFVRAFQGMLPPDDRAAMIQWNGQLSAAGERRIRNAVIASAYDDPTMLGRLTDSTDDNVKSVGNAVAATAPKYAKLKAAIADGGRSDLDITPYIADAANTLSDLRKNGRSVDEHLNQRNMFEQSPHSAIAEDLLKYFDANKRSGAKIKALLDEYADAADRTGDPRNVKMFDLATPTKDNVFAAAKKRVEENNGASTSQAGMDFSTEGRPAGSAENSTHAAGTGPAEGTETAPTGATNKGLTQPRTVTVNGSTVMLTPEQSIAWDAADKRYADRMTHADRIDSDHAQAVREGRDIDNTRNTDANRKSAGMQLSAERRQITGQLTAKEQAKVDKQKVGNYVGKPVTVDGKPHTVVGNSFGKVRVKDEDGVVRSVDATDVHPIDSDFAAKAAELDSKAADVLADLKRNIGTSANSGLDPTNYAKLVHYGALKIASGMYKFTDFAEHMVGELGEWIRPHLADIWNAAKERATNGIEPASEKSGDSSLPKSAPKVDIPNGPRTLGDKGISLARETDPAATQKTVLENADAIDNQRRGVQTWATQRAKAEALGVKYEHYENMKPGDTLNTEENTALHGLRKAYEKDATAAENKFQQTGDAKTGELAKDLRAKATHLLVVEHGTVAEAARVVQAQQSFHEAFKSVTPTAEDLFHNFPKSEKAPGGFPRTSTRTRSLSFVKNKIVPADEMARLREAIKTEAGTCLTV